MADLKGALNGGGVGGDDIVPSSGLGLVNTTSVQLARYPGDGRGYVRHRDTPKSAQDSEEAERKVPPHTATPKSGFVFVVVFLAIFLPICIGCARAIQHAASTREWNTCPNGWRVIFTSSV